MKKLGLRNNENGRPAEYLTTVELWVSKNILNAHFFASHSQCFSAGDTFNSDLFNGDVVELFIYTGTPNHYFEIEVSPNNTHFLGDIFNNGVTRKLTLLKEDFFTSRVEKTKNGYEVFIEIPLEKLGCSKNDIRLNAFRIETDGGISNAHLFAVNPTMCNSFHVRDYLTIEID